MTIEEIARDDHPDDRLEEPDRLSGRCRPTIPKMRQPDITRARTLLGLGAARSQLDEGLVKTIDYFRTKVDRPA